MSRPVVSFDDEPLVLVDVSDREVGSEAKRRAHDGAGLLHRAFSVFLFDGRGQVLLQQRSAAKRLWPLVWSNSCCSHPRAGEPVEAAAARRVGEELSLSARLVFLYKFEYHALYGDAGAEHELCWVFAGRGEGEVDVHPGEVAAFEWVDPADLDRRLEAEPARFSPWLRLEWPRLRRDHWPAVARLLPDVPGRG